MLLLYHVLDVRICLLYMIERIHTNIASILSCLWNPSSPSSLSRLLSSFQNLFLILMLRNLSPTSGNRSNLLTTSLM